jgi:arsenate reductase
MTHPPEPGPQTVLFVCLHGSAKSVIAAQYFNRGARERGLAYVAESAGVDADAEVPQAVVEALGRDGFDVRGHSPQPMPPNAIARAGYLISLGCELPPHAAQARLETWEDLPMVSDGYETARDAIVDRVDRLLDSLR